MIFYLFGVSFFIIFIYFLLLPYLKKLKFGQVVREVGPRNHLKKNGTPTMGGTLIFISFIIVFLSLLVFIKLNYGIKFDYLFIMTLFIPLIGYFSIGLVDDLLIIVKRKNNGLKPNLKFAMELLVALMFYLSLIILDFDTKIRIFSFELDLLFFYGLLIILMFTSTTNATNLTDGVDGLLTSTTLPILVGYIILGLTYQNYLVVILSISLFISLLLFLFFNFPKAKLFMGDTGSLFIGAFIAIIPILLKEELSLLIFGFVYLFETLSVILQVSYFKLSKGKRLFKMTPFHHHLELIGLSDFLINLIFFLCSCLFTFLGLVYTGVLF